MGIDKGFMSVRPELEVETYHVGLVNLGNTCFFNCIIQCLSSTVPLLNAINSPPMSSPSLVALAPSTTDHEPPLSPLPITKAFLSLMERLSALPAGDASSQRRAKIFNPKMLLKELSTKHEEYADTTQQDAHELLRNLLGGIEMEEVDLIKKVDRRPLSSGDASSTVHQSSARMTRSDTPTLARNGEDSEGNEEDSSSDEDSNSDSEPRSSLRPFINTLFGGKLTSVIVCEFGHVSLMDEDFLDLSLSLKNENAPVKVRRRDRIRKMFSNKPSMSEAEASTSASEAEDEGGMRGTSLGRRKSLASLGDAVGRRSFWGRSEGTAKSASSSRDPSPTGITRISSSSNRPPPPKIPKSTKIPKPTPDQQSYIKALLADLGSSSTAVLPLRWALPTGSTSSSPTSSRSTLSATHCPPATTDLHECIRQFTAVERLEAENQFACKKCWKLLNPRSVQAIKKKEKTKRERRERSNTMKPVVRDGDNEDALVASRSGSRLDPPGLIRRVSTPLSEGIVSVVDSSANFADLSEDDGNLTDSTFSHSTEHLPIPGTASLTTANVATLSLSAISANTSISTHDLLTTSTETSKASVAFVPTPSITSAASSRPLKLPPKLSRHILRNAQKRYLLSPTQLPPILVIQFKRFQQTKASMSLFGSSFSNLRKIDIPLTFPLELDLKPFLAPVTKPPNKMASPPRRPSLTPSPTLPSSVYRLYSVVEHTGSLSTGHYSCYFLSDRYRPRQDAEFGGEEEDRPTSARRWFHASDEVVRACTVGEVLRSKAYILFYEQVDLEVEGTSDSKQSSKM